MEDVCARTLLERCRDSRDASAWEELTKRFGPRLRAGVVRGFRRAGRFPSDVSIEDLVQESYCRLLAFDGKALRRCRGTDAAAIGAYLGRIAERVALDHLRRRATSKRARDRTDSLDRLVEQGSESILASPPRAERRLLTADLRRRFTEACRRAAGKGGRLTIEVLRLALFEGMTSHEISERLEWRLSPNGIDSLLYRARKRLAAQGLMVPRRHAVDPL